MRLFFNRKVLSRSKRQAAARLNVEQLEQRITPGFVPPSAISSDEISYQVASANGLVHGVSLNVPFTPPAQGDPDSAPPFLNGVFLPPAAFVTAPASLSGVATDSTVTDSTVGVALANVTITMVSVSDPATTFTTTTDANGSYTLTGVPAGTYTVTAALPGYQTGTIANVVESAGANTTLNFVLTPTPIA